MNKGEEPKDEGTPLRSNAAAAGDTESDNTDVAAAVSPSQEVEIFFQSSQDLSAMQSALNKTIEGLKRNPEKEININAYLNALEKAPHLILSESNPSWFLQREDGNAVAASRRLLKYWSSRVDIFGSEKAYSSILNGNALSSAALLCLRSGALALLPNDTAGRTVLCVDLKRREKGLLGDDNNKDTTMTGPQMQFSFWVLLQCLSNPKKALSDGVVLVWTFSNNASIDLPKGKPFFSLVAEAMPLKVHSRHIACCAPRGSKRMYLDQFAPGADRSSGALEFPDAIPVATYHVGESPEELCQELGKHGLEKHALPLSLGGTWDYQAYNDFVDRELSSRSSQLGEEGVGEKDRKQAPRVSNKSTSDSSSNAVITDETNMPLRASTGDAEDDDDERSGTSASNDSRVRLENESGALATRSVKKRKLDEDGTSSAAKRRAPEEVTTKVAAQPKSDDDQDDNSKSSSTATPHPVAQLRQADTGIVVADVKVDAGHGIKEASLQKLQAAVETIPAECFDKGTTEEEKAAYVRKRNAVYSKRKYYKDKLRFESLTGSKETLEAENKLLKDENQRLEKLHQMAQSAIRLHGAGINLSWPVNAFASGPLGVGGVDPFPPPRGHSGGPLAASPAAKLPPGNVPKQAPVSEDSLKKLQDARETVPAECFEKGTTKEEKAAYIRKRNAVYSKRKYYKDKLRMESLTNDKDSLLTENAALKEENQRLEKLYHLAQCAVQAHETGAAPSHPPLDLLVPGVQSASNSFASARAQSLRQTGSSAGYFGVGAPGGSSHGNPGAIGRNMKEADAIHPVDSISPAARLSSPGPPPQHLWPHQPPMVAATDPRLLAAETEIFRRSMLGPGPAPADNTMALMQELQRGRMSGLPLHHMQQQQHQQQPPLVGTPANWLSDMRLLQDRQYQQQQQQQRQRPSASSQQPGSRGSIEQVHQLLHEARVRQDLATQMAMELTSDAQTPTHATASPLEGATGQNTAFMYPQSGWQQQQQQLLHPHHQQRLSMTASAMTGRVPAHYGNHHVSSPSPSSMHDERNMGKQKKNQLAHKRG